MKIDPATHSCETKSGFAEIRALPTEQIQHELELLRKRNPDTYAFQSARLLHALNNRPKRRFAKT